ncbi:MAG: septation protein SpoVG family protein [Candidatus Omnitrophota bacterium]|nr:MAG: septation protein SpoVG family protein [Candidatus Omnitrophota bacterium]
MEITEVRISLKESEGKRLKAYATVTFDNSFVVRNIKVVEGNSGLFVAMPARKLKQFCARCGKKIDAGSRYCNHCGAQLPPSPKDLGSSRQATHQDLAHPINQQFRDYLQSKVLDAYYREKESPSRGTYGESKGESARSSEGENQDTTAV